MIPYPLFIITDLRSSKDTAESHFRIEIDLRNEIGESKSFIERLDQFFTLSDNSEWSRSSLYVSHLIPRITRIYLRFAFWIFRLQQNGRILWWSVDHIVTHLWTGVPIAAHECGLFESILWFNSSYFERSLRSHTRRWFVIWFTHDSMSWWGLIKWNFRFCSHSERDNRSFVDHDSCNAVLHTERSTGESCTHRKDNFRRRRSSCGIIELWRFDAQVQYRFTCCLPLVISISSIPHYRARVCMCLRVAGRFSCFALQKVWTPEIKAALETLATDDDDETVQEVMRRY